MRQRIGAWTVIFVLALQAVFAPGLAQGMAGPAENDLVVVCTAAGMVSLHRDGTPAERNSAADRAGGCVFCLPLMQGHLAVPPAVTLIEPVEMVRQAPFHLPPAAAHVLPRLDGGAHPQAPPLS